MRQFHVPARALRAAVLALVVTASPALAGTPRPAERASAPPPSASHSIMYGDAAVGARAAATRPAVDKPAAAAAAVRMDRHVGAGKNAALMVVGAAGIITGAIVGGGTGAAIAVGGAALGLYGLYNFVK